MKYILNHEGKPFNRFFEDISAIPRLTFHEEAISEYLVQFAEERGLWCYRDKLWNVIIKKPASPGYEDHPPVMLQGHTDMVGEKTSGSNFNFETDPLDLYVEDGFLMAKDTTLGADCGHGVAYMLAVLDDTTLKHPPIEAFFSVQEEAGIGGPRFVDYSQFTAKRLINTDVMFEGATYDSTANVLGGYYLQDVQTEEAAGTAYELEISGLHGGHAAMEIFRDGANAIQTAARVLYHIMKLQPIRIVALEGGTIKNNIPTNCRVRFIQDGTSLAELKVIAERSKAELQEEFSLSDPNLEVSICAYGNVSGVAVTKDSSWKIMEALQILPTGACRRSLKVKDFVLASRNIGTAELKLDKNIFKIGCMFRSAYLSKIESMKEESDLIAAYLSAHYEEEYRYYGYNVDVENSLMTQIFAEVYLT